MWSNKMLHRDLRMGNSLLCFQSSYLQAQCHFKVTLKIAMRGNNAKPNNGYWGFIFISMYICVLFVENTLAQEKHWGCMKQSTQKGQEHSSNMSIKLNQFSVMHAQSFSLRTCYGIENTHKKNPPFLSTILTT